jgi:hypothetical protein
MSGGILGHFKPDIRLVDEDFEPGPPPGTSLYGKPAPIPISEYWNWLLRQDGPVLARLAAEYNELAASIASGADAPGAPEEIAPVPARATPIAPEGTPPPAAPETDSTVTPTASLPPPDGDAA